MNFPFVDLGIAVIVIWAVIGGAKMGFLKSLLNLGTLILSLLLAFFLTSGLIVITGNWFGIKAGALAILDAVLNLVIMIILFSLFEIIFGYLERHVIRNSPNGGTEAASKILGLSIGVVKATILVVVALTLVVFLFPGENTLTVQIERSIVGHFLFETNPLPSIIGALI